MVIKTSAKPVLRSSKKVEKPKLKQKGYVAHAFPQVIEYSRSPFKINQYLRGTEYFPGIEENVEALKWELELLKSPVPRLTYRGQYRDTPHSGFISTSTSKKVAKEFGNKVITIWGYGADISALSNYPKEAEILYPPSEWVEVEGVFVQKGMEGKYKQWLEAGMVSKSESEPNIFRLGDNGEHIVFLENEDKGWLKAWNIFPSNFKPLYSGFEVFTNPVTNQDEGYDYQKVETEGSGYLKAMPLKWKKVRYLFNSKAMWVLEVEENDFVNGWAVAVALPN